MGLLHDELGTAGGNTVFAAITQVGCDSVGAGLQAGGVNLREEPLPVTFTPVPFQLYVTIRLGSKLDSLTVAVTVSPAKTSVGSTEQAALGGTAGGPIGPKRKTIPAERRDVIARATCPRRRKRDP